MPAQPGADHDHQIDCLVKILDRRRTDAIQCAQILRMIVGHDAAPRPTGYHPQSFIQERLDFGTCVARACASPDHRPTRTHQGLREAIDVACRGMSHHRLYRGEGIGVRRTRNGQALDIDRDFNAHRAAWRGARLKHRAAKHIECLMGRADAKGGFAHRLEHAELIGHVVHRAHPLAEHSLGRLARDVQHGSACKACFDQAGHGIGRPGAGAADDDAQPAARACEAVGHVAAARLAARHDHAHAGSLRDPVHDGNVMDRDDAEHGARAVKLEEFSDQSADGVLFHNRLCLQYYFSQG